jgi:hypothetical protein
MYSRLPDCSHGLFSKIPGIIGTWFTPEMMKLPAKKAVPAGLPVS